MYRGRFAWDFKVGPAAILTFVSMIVQVVVVVWVASSLYSGLTSDNRALANKIENQGTKIAEVEKGSDKRFETVVAGIKDARGRQDETIQRVTKLETALTYIGDQIHRIETAVTDPVKAKR